MSESFQQPKQPKQQQAMDEESKHRYSCGVCGARAIGINYGALTCGSCKVFFCRNETKALKCYGAGVCPINLSNRKFCPSCRLNRCYAIGMQKTCTIATSCSDTLSSPSPSSSSSSSSSSTNRTSPSPPSNQQNIRSTLEFAISHFDTQNATAIMLGGGDEIFHQSNRNRKKFTLNDCELRLIGEVCGAMNRTFVNEYSLRLVGEITDPVAAINWPCAYARRIVRFCKSIAAYRLLSAEDQINILRPFVLEIIIIRSSFLYDRERHGIPVISDEHATDALWVSYPCKTYNHSGVSNPFEQPSKIKYSLHTELENDEILRNLAIITTLWQPRERLSCPEFIRNQYFLYCCLLQRYLEFKYQRVDEAQSRYRSIVDIIHELPKCMAAAKQSANELGISHFDEMLREVLGF